MSWKTAEKVYQFEGLEGRGGGGRYLRLINLSRRTGRRDLDLKKKKGVKLSFQRK